MTYPSVQTLVAKAGKPVDAMSASEARALLTQALQADLGVAYRVLSDWADEARLKGDVVEKCLHCLSPQANDPVVGGMRRLVAYDPARTICQDEFDVNLAFYANASGTHGVVLVAPKDVAIPISIAEQEVRLRWTGKEKPAMLDEQAAYGILLEKLYHQYPLAMAFLQQQADYAKAAGKLEIGDTEDSAELINQTVPVLGSDAHRLVVERHFGVQFNFLNCCGAPARPSQQNPVPDDPAQNPLAQMPVSPQRESIPPELWLAQLKLQGKETFNC